MVVDAGETTVTRDADDIDERDYYTLAYAERRGLETSRATDEFAAEAATNGGVSGTTDAEVGDD